MAKVILKLGKQVRYKITCNKCDTQFIYDSGDIIEARVNLLPTPSVTKLVSCPICYQNLLADLSTPYDPKPPPTTEYARSTKN